ncbi:hypothetical protein [Methylobacterium sp. A54F]
MDNMTLDDYRKLVEQVMRETMSSGNEAVPRVFTNVGTEHAKVVISTMLDYAQQGLYAYSDKLSAEVWLPEKIIGFLNRAPSADICVIVDKVDALNDAESALFYLQEQVASGRIKVRFTGYSKMPSHICVTDERHIRIESDASSRKATVVFGDPELGSSGARMFDACWERCSTSPVAIKA